MERKKKAYVVMLFFSTLLGAVGQFFFKVGVTGSVQIFALFIFLGLFSYLISTIIYFYVLARVHLSWAYGFGGLSYIFASVIAFLFLGEQVPPLRWAGILVIALGTALIGIS